MGNIKRGLAAATAALALATGCTTTAEPAPPTTATTTPVTTTAAPVSRDGEFAALEQRFDARLGVYAIDTGSGSEVAFRADDRFAYASTFKALAVGAILRAGTDLDRVIRYDRDDLVPNSPITGEHTEMTVRALCDAAIRFSDNTAANLLLTELGGPSGFTEAMRAVGDRTLRADRYEIELNTAVPGDDRDTSTPRALATTLRAFTLGDALPEDRREILVEMLRGNTTGAKLIRAGAPDGWIVGDKTGAGAYGTRNDIAVLWPPDRAPIVMAVMTTRPTPDAEYRDALVAEAAEVAIAALG
ncbi:class A beta-lactamase [Actinokineospora sp. UTMC 2448]|uniref:class A beta-lactamase n=1 Tax=Actinokineospora sp. UTMC 2448 TaxID=2268449 RepID=UPI0021641538|nr:class A beta-lactamase [Actinokineospora sp. UTMC 2448]UVS77356.1 Beta-lactamase precursor [Actinokineospora sp. UTMC 2448]